MIHLGGGKQEYFAAASNIVNLFYKNMGIGAWGSIGISSEVDFSLFNFGFLILPLYLFLILFLFHLK